MVNKRAAKTARLGSWREGLLNRIVSRIRSSLDLQEILTAAVEEIRGFLGSDRVKIYRFDGDGSGEVIAESIRGRCLPSLLGLHFPASNIPPQVREMFVKARQRAIVDVASQRKMLYQLDCPKTGESLVTEDIHYLPVDPCHIEYLTAMGVSSSLTVPILYENNLWGLLTCHQVKPRQFSESELKIVQLLVDQVAIAIAQCNLLVQAQQQARDEVIINQINRILHSPLPLTQKKQTVLEQIAKVLQASGARLYITAEPTGKPAQLYTWGDQPIAEIEETPFWQQIIRCNYEGKAVTSEDCKCSILPVFGSKNIVSHLYSINDLYQEPQLQYLLPAFASTSIRSLLLVPLQYHQQCIGCITIFRNEIETERLWEGRWNQDSQNLLQLRAFETGQEIGKRQAKAWNADEIKLAQTLGLHLYMSIMQRRVEDTIKHQASYDILTGLPNRLLFNDRLALALANTHQQGEILAVLFLDLDGFKKINETLGHGVGDRLLQDVAQRLKKCLRESDTIARWGGDEFTLLLSPIVCAESAAQIAQEILSVFNLPFQLQGKGEFYIKASIGIALAPYDGEDAETLLKNADAAMHRVKQQGRNNYQLYTPSIGTQALEKMVLENNLYKALERGEFLLHYQPQIDLKTGKIVGMEALLRWQHPEQGLISPNRFIPLAEETGLINPIGEWALRTACAQNKAWQLVGLPPLRMAVNLSARQFMQQNLIDKIAQILAETGLEPRYLEIEITETTAIQDIDFTISMLQTLKNMGIYISMDDFGTGYSSLSSLKRFPLSTLKIDRSFIDDAPIIKAVIALGHGLNLKVIAEGVETPGQLEFLREVKCDDVQGYFLSKPLSAEAATNLCMQQAAGGKF
ncbi:MAG TPA: diguanylate cyclase [Cyanobacteria bacterium UBA11372]|nr:diguanylate cyclase [Cyanobacteria bacterium UBA11372]